MKHIAGMLASFLMIGIAGCVYAPQEKAEGERFNFKTARTPYSAAICIARNANGRSGNISAEERLLGESSMEVIVRSLGWTGGTLAVAQVHRDGVFSTVSIWVTNLIRADRVSFARQLMGDC